MDNRGRIEKVRRMLQFDGLVVVDSFGKSGGLTLLWKIKEQVKLQSLSKNHIDVEICEDVKDTWRLTGIYGEPDRQQRRKTWDLLRNLARDANLRWCVIGDLNNVFSKKDKIGEVPYPNWLVEGFNEVVNEIGLIDLDLVGHQYTWERGRDTDTWTEIRLDRSLTSKYWLRLFPGVKLYNVEGTTSDHSPILLVPDEVKKIKGKRKFCFENAWLTELMCKQLVTESWELGNNADIQTKIKHVSDNMFQWG